MADKVKPIFVQMDHDPQAVADDLANIAHLLRDRLSWRCRSVVVSITSERDDVTCVVRYERNDRARFSVETIATPE